MDDDGSIWVPLGLLIKWHCGKGSLPDSMIWINYDEFCNRFGRNGRCGMSEFDCDIWWRWNQIFLQNVNSESDADVSNVYWQHTGHWRDYRFLLNDNDDLDYWFSERWIRLSAVKAALHA